MTYQEQLSNVFGKIKGTFELIKKSLDREESKNIKDTIQSAARNASEANAQVAKPKATKVKRAAKSFPKMSARNQSMKDASSVTGHTGSAYKGKGSINTDAAIFNKNSKGKKVGKK